MRYAIAKLLFRFRFPHGSLTATDFRPHFDGHLINACVCFSRAENSREAQAIVERRLRQSFQWMRLLRFLLRRGDRVQYFVGRRRPAQWLLKAWASRDDLVHAVQPRDVTYC